MIKIAICDDEEILLEKNRTIVQEYITKKAQDLANLISERLK